MGLVHRAYEEQKTLRPDYESLLRKLDSMRKQQGVGMSSEDDHDMVEMEQCKDEWVAAVNKEEESKDGGKDTTVLQC